MVRLFILRWALTLVALLASGAASAAVPETQPPRVQGGNAHSGDARSALPKGAAPKGSRRADATCDGADEDEQLTDAAAAPAGAFSAGSGWLNHLLLSQLWSFELAGVAPRQATALPVSGSAQRPLEVAVRPTPREVSRALQPRAPPLA
ncbi:MAG: hypothetical protein R3B07_07830 [Polyangiaceae bacterium]